MAAVLDGGYLSEKCQKHTETIHGLCDTCDEVVCVKCMMGHHNGHTFTDLEARVGEKKDSLQDLMLEMKRRVPVLQQRVAELQIQDDKNQRDTEAVTASITQKGVATFPNSFQAQSNSFFSPLISKYFDSKFRNDVHVMIRNT